MFNTFFEQFQLPARRSSQMASASMTKTSGFSKLNSSVDLHEKQRSGPGRFITAPTAFSTAMKLAKQASKRQATEPEQAFSKEQLQDASTDLTEMSNIPADDLLENTTDGQLPAAEPVDEIPLLEESKQAELPVAMPLESVLPAVMGLQQFDSSAQSGLMTPSSFAQMAFSTPERSHWERLTNLANVTSTTTEANPVVATTTNARPETFDALQLKSFLQDLENVLPADVFTDVKAQLQSVTVVENASLPTTLTDVLAKALRPATEPALQPLGPTLATLVSEQSRPAKSVFELRLASELQRTITVSDQNGANFAFSSTKKHVLKTPISVPSGQVSSPILPAEALGENTLSNEGVKPFAMLQRPLQVADVNTDSGELAADNTRLELTITNPLGADVNEHLTNVPSFPDFWADVRMLNNVPIANTSSPLQLSAPLDSGLIAEQPLSAQAVDAVRDLMASKRQELILNLNPEHLGSMRVSIAHHRVAGEDKITATLMVDNLDAKSHLDATMNDLHERLQRHGLSLAKVEVIQASAATSESKSDTRHNSQSDTRPQHMFAQADSGNQGYSRSSSQPERTRIQNTAVLSPGEDDSRDSHRVPSEDASHSGVTLPDGRVNLRI